MKNLTNLRAFKVEYLQVTDTKPARIKITDLRYNKTFIVNYGANTESQEMPRAIEFLSNKGIEITHQTWCEKNGQHQYTILLTRDFNEIK